MGRGDQFGGSETDLADKNAEKLGPTGKYDFGEPLHPGDRGGINAAMGVRNGKIVLEFGTTLSFLVLTKEEALVFAAGLEHFAQKL
jgi:hypothetical protein